MLPQCMDQIGMHDILPNGSYGENLQVALYSPPENHEPVYHHFDTIQPPWTEKYFVLYPVLKRDYCRITVKIESYLVKPTAPQYAPRHPVW